MPFIKKNHFQDTQPSSSFVGRTGEILFFVHNILQPEVPSHNILSISGQGGVGKSTLLARFIAEGCEVPFKDYCLTASVDERQSTPISIMEKLAQQLHLTGKFEKALKEYKEALQKQQMERQTLREKLFGSLPDVAGSVVEGIPVAGPLLREGTKSAASHLLKEHQASQAQQATKLLETSIEDLTRAFVTDLNRLADTHITLSSTGQKRQQRIVLFFDTFEQLATEATPWFLDHFLAIPISSNVVLVVAGRDPIEHTSPNDPKRWLPYCDDGTIYWISLNSFTEDDTRMYLIKRGITDADRIANIWHLSRGLPLYLSFLTSNPHGNIDPTKGVIVNFLRWIPEQEPIKRQLALEVALLSKPFNQDDLEAFSYVPASDCASLYQWLTKQPFVRSRSQDGRHLYHDVAQDLFSRHLYQSSQNRYDEIRRGLAAYYQKLLEKIQAERGKEVYRSEEWFELFLAIIYQLLLLPDQTSHIKAIEHVLLASEHTNKEQDREFIRALRDLAQKPSSYHISPAAQSVAMQLLHYIEAYQDKQKWLTATSVLMDKIVIISSFNQEAFENIYYRFIKVYRSQRNITLGSEKYEQALKLFEATNYLRRGWINFYIENYQEALTFHNQALEHNPKDAAAYVGRGWVYNNLREYQQAIADFEHAGELDLTANPGGRSNGLRWAYYHVGQYQQALIANDYFLKRDTEDYEPHAFRLQCYLSLKEYQQAIEERNRVFELAPRRADVCVKVGWAYFYAKSYSEALAFHNQALEHNPQNAEAYHGRGWAYNNLGEYKQAIDDFEHVLDLAPNYSNPRGLYNGLRWAYYDAGKYHQALATNEYFLKQASKDYKPYVFQCRCFRSLKDYPQSIDACNYALKLALEPANVYFQRGLTYLWLRDLEQAQADFTQSCEMKPAKIDVALIAEWARMGQEISNLLVSERLETIATLDLEDDTAHICLGIALLLRRNLRGALAELEQALGPKEWKAHFWKGMICAFLEQDEEAITAIEKALCLELPPILLGPLHWFEQEKPVFYRKYGMPLLAKYE